MAIITKPFRLSSPRKKRNNRGLTLIELMVTVSVLALLLGLAAPSFTPLFERWRIMQTVEGMKSSLMLARSEAIKRGGNVFLQKLPNNTQKCITDGGSQDWDCGWVVFSDLNGNATWNAGEEIQTFHAPAGITITRTTDGATVRLNRWGMANGANMLGFTIAPSSSGISASSTKGLCMAAGGRIRIINQEEVPCTP